MKIKVVIENDIKDCLDGDVGLIIHFLQLKMKKYVPDEYETLQLEFDYDYGFYNDEKYTQVALVGYREETAAEKRSRIAKQRQINTTQEMAEREMLRKLKNKYE